jgi:hypothetical protein
MPNIGLTNLTSGELSPIMLGRPDTQRYPNACIRLENWLLTTTGMWVFRPGFEVMGFPKNAGGAVRLWPFQFSDQQGNQVEIGEGYARFWHTLGQVIDPGTGLPVEVATPFPGADLDLLGFCQSADFLFVIHESLGIFTIQRSSLTSWTFGSFQLKDGPYGRQNADTAQHLLVAAVSGADYTVQATGFPKDPFGEGDEGRLIRVKDSGTWRWLIVKTVVDATNVVATAQGAGAIAGTDFTDWRLGLYSGRLGWPATGTIHEQRFVLAGAAAAPDRLDGSAIAGFDDFAPRDPLTDDGAYAYALGQKGVDRIVALGESNDLIVLTGGAEHRVAGDSTGTAITPTQVWQKPISPDGAKRIPSISVGNSEVFIDKYGLNIRAISYDIRFQNYAPDNLTLLADHMCWLDENSPGFQALCWQGNPFGTIWTIRGNDELAGAIYNPKENVLGWHRHPQGMPVPPDDDTVYDPPAVESISVMKGPTHDELWQVVRRELPGRTLSTIERMGRPGLWDVPFESQCYLDCSLRLRNAPTATLTPSAKSGSGVHFVASDVTGGFAFTAAHVGQFIKHRWNAGANLRGRTIWRTGIARITARNSDTDVTCDVLAPFRSTAAIVSGAWGLTVGRVTGLDHLEGLLVKAVSDGRVCAPQAVSGGAIVLDVPGWEVAVGLPYQGMMVSLPLDPGPQPAIGMGRDVRIERITARLLNTLGGEFASVPETDEQAPRWEALLPYNQGQAAPQAAPLPVSGIRKLWGAGEWTREGQIAIRQTEPLPCNVQMIVAHVYAPFVQP